MHHIYQVRLLTQFNVHQNDDFPSIQSLSMIGEVVNNKDISSLIQWNDFGLWEAWWYNVLHHLPLYRLTKPIPFRNSRDVRSTHPSNKKEELMTIPYVYIWQGRCESQHPEGFNRKISCSFQIRKTCSHDPSILIWSKKTMWKDGWHISCNITLPLGWSRALSTIFVDKKFIDCNKLVLNV